MTRSYDDLRFFFFFFSGSCLLFSGKIPGLLLLYCLCLIASIFNGILLGYTPGVSPFR